MSTRIVSTAINHEKFSHKFLFSVIVENMYEHKVVGPINQVKNYEDAREEVEGHLKKQCIKTILTTPSWKVTKKSNDIFRILQNTFSELLSSYLIHFTYIYNFLQFFYYLEQQVVLLWRRNLYNGIIYLFRWSKNP